MSVITIHGIDSTLQATDEDTAYKVYDALTFFIRQNNQTFPVNLAQVDGASVRMPTGLVPAAMSLLKNIGSGVKPTIVREVSSHSPDLSRLSTLKIPLFKAQDEAIRALLQRPIGIMNAPTGSGKGNMVAALCAAFPSSNIGVFTITPDLAADLQTRITSVTGEPCGILSSSSRKLGRVTVLSATWIWAHHEKPQIKNELRRYDVIIVDECHGFGTLNRYKILRMCTNAHVRYGFSATSLGRNDGSNTYVVANLGPLVVKIGYTELVEEGRIAKGRVVFIPFMHTNPQHRVQYRGLYTANIASNRDRNAIAGLILKSMPESGFPCIIFAQALSHIKELMKILQRVFPGESAVVMGETPSHIRRTIYENVRDGKVKVLLATRVAFTGIDIPALRTVITMDTGSSTVDNTQKPGRAMRYLSTKEDFVIFDIYDVWPEKTSAGRPRLFERQAQERKKIYKDLGMEVIIGSGDVASIVRQAYK